MKTLELSSVKLPCKSELFLEKLNFYEELITEIKIDAFTYTNEIIPPLLISGIINNYVKSNGKSVTNVAFYKNKPKWRLQRTLNIPPIPLSDVLDDLVNEVTKKYAAGKPTILIRKCIFNIEGIEYEFNYLKPANAIVLTKIIKKVLVKLTKKK